VNGKKNGRRKEKYSLLKILIQSTFVTEARKRSPADAGSALIKEFLMAMARLPIVMSFPTGEREDESSFGLLKIFYLRRHDGGRIDREDCRL
jgi:hypothetical protein